MIEALFIPQNINTHLTIDDFNIIENIGTNNWGNICKIIEINTNQIYLSTIIDKNIIDKPDTLLNQIQNNIKMMEHPFIHKIEAISENDQFIFIFQEYHDLNLQSLVNNTDYWNKIDLGTKISIFSNITNAIAHCHKNNITLNNISLENIYIDNQGTPCLTDFSMSNINPINNHNCPDLNMEPPFISPAIDCWDLGILLTKLFSSQNSNELYNIKDGLLLENPAERWTTETLLNYLASIGY